MNFSQEIKSSEDGFNALKTDSVLLISIMTTQVLTPQNGVIGLEKCQYVV